jgi:hypothetical protein
MGEKTTLARIKEQYSLDDVSLATLAEVNPTVIEKMLAGEPVAKWQADQVLQTLTEILEEDYNLNTVEVALLPEPEP